MGLRRSYGIADGELLYGDDADRSIKHYISSISGVILNPYDEEIELTITDM